MRKLIYSIGVTLFLAFLTFHVTTSLTNPFYGVSMEALAQGSGSGGSDGDTTSYWSTDNCWKYSMYDGCYESARKCAWDGFDVCSVSDQEFCADLCY